MLKNLNQKYRNILIELIMDIRSEIHYSILLLANHPDAKVVKEVRDILAINRNKEMQKE
jgi:hypothetical protein